MRAIVEERQKPLCTFEVLFVLKEYIPRLLMFLFYLQRNIFPAVKDPSLLFMFP